MKHCAQLVILTACCLTVVFATPVDSLSFEKAYAQATTFEDKINARVELFDASNRTLVANLIDLAYSHNLPLGIEYIDKKALTQPIGLVLRNESIQGILIALVQQVPEYKVTFSGGVVDVYAPKAREDTSNLLNKTIKNFGVSELDTTRADMELFCALSREVLPSGGCGGSIATGQWGPKRVSVHLRNATVYEILNAITSQNGEAVWTVIAAPDNLSKIPFGGLWHMYPLDPLYKEAVLNQLASISVESRTGP